MLENSGRNADAAGLFTRSIDGFEALASESPKVAETQNYLGYVYEQQGKLLAKTGQGDKAKLALERAITHQRQAIKLTDGKLRAYRTMLRAIWVRWPGSASRFGAMTTRSGLRSRSPGPPLGAGMLRWTPPVCWRGAWSSRAEIRSWTGPLATS